MRSDRHHDPRVDARPRWGDPRLDSGGGGAGRIEISARDSILIDGAGAQPGTLFEFLKKIKPTPAGNLHVGVSDPTLA